MYAMVVLETRYFSGVTAVVWGAIAASTGIAREEWRTKVFRAACLALGGWVVCTALWTLSAGHAKNGQSARQVAVAERLHSMGMKPGDRVALIGNGFHELSWARLERVKIVAEVPEETATDDSAAAFWSSGPQGEQTVLGHAEDYGCDSRNRGCAAGGVAAGMAPRGRYRARRLFFPVTTPRSLVPSTYACLGFIRHFIP